MPQERDLYEILGVARSAGPDEIKSAYRRLARKHHPDVNPGDKAADEKFKEVAAAFEVLSNPEKRKLYDELGADAQKIGFDPQKARAYREWRSARTRTGGAPFEAEGVPFDVGDLGDLFGDLFGGVRGRGARAAGPARGPDIEATIEVALRDVVFGASREIAFERPDRRQARLEVKVPKGAAEGTVIRLAGQGGAGPRGRPPGDLLLTIRLAHHPLLRVEGRDLSFDLPVTVAEAMFGAEVRVPTFEGDVQLKVPAGSQSGRKLRLRGKGLPDLHGGRGDLYALVQVVVPEAKGAEAEAAARKLSELYREDVRGGLRL